MEKDANPNLSFEEGFHAGYRSIKGDGAALPGTPAHAIPAGYSAYGWGFKKGVEAAGG